VARLVAAASSSADKADVFVKIWMATWATCSDKHFWGSVLATFDFIKGDRLPRAPSPQLRSTSSIATQDLTDDQSKALQEESDALFRKLMAVAQQENTDAVTQELLRTYRPCASCAKYKRYGEGNDGGYLMCEDDFKEKGMLAAYSYGINGFDGWGNSFSQSHGVPVNQYDCTNPTVPTPCATCTLHFHYECIRAELEPAASASYKTLTQQLTANGHNNLGTGTLVMKMDVEGAEWGALANAPPETLARFEQIAFEVHFLGNTARYGQFAAVMDKLLQDFVVVHNHGNNCCGSVRLGEYTIPKVFELTMVRRSAVQTSPCVSTRLNAQDAKNVMLKPHPVPVDLPANATFVQV